MKYINLYKDKADYDANFKQEDYNVSYIEDIRDVDYKKQLPTIQEAWIDSGIARWISTNRQVQFTDLELERIPEVRDSNILYTLQDTFRGMTKLKELPNIDGSNATSLASSFYNCKSIKEIKSNNYSNVNSLSNTFYGMESLEIIGDLNLSDKVTLMLSAFAKCSLLKRIPRIDFTNVKVADNMLSECSSLTELPEDFFESMNRSTSLQNMSKFLNKCSSLVINIPELNLLYVINASNMFSESGITGIDGLNLPVATNVSRAFDSCTNLVRVRSLNIPNATNIDYLYTNCSALEEVPELSAENLTSILGVYSGCSSLTNIRITSDLSKCTTFRDAFTKCNSLITIDGELDASSCTGDNSLLSTFYNCKELVDVRLSNVGVNVSFSDSSKLSKESVLWLFEHAKVVDPSLNRTMTFPRGYITRGFTEEEVKVVTDKGWTIVE